MNILKIGLVLLFLFIGWISYAMSSESGDIKGEFSVITDRQIEKTVAYDEVDKEEMELYVSPFVRSLIHHPGSMPPILDFDSVRYPYARGEYGFKLKDLIGILVEGENLKPCDTKLRSELTGDHWNWHHFGGKETASGIYYSLDKLYPYYSDPFGNYYSDDMGFNVKECFPSIIETVMGKGKVKSVVFFTKDSKRTVTVPDIILTA